MHKVFHSRRKSSLKKIRKEKTRAIYCKQLIKNHTRTQSKENLSTKIGRLARISNIKRKKKNIELLQMHNSQQTSKGDERCDKRREYERERAVYQGKSGLNAANGRTTSIYNSEQESESGEIINHQSSAEEINRTRIRRRRGGKREEEE